MKMICWIVLLLFSVQVQALKDVNVIEKIHEAQKTFIQQDEKQRKVLSTLFEINKKMKKMVSEKSKLTADRFQMEEAVETMTEQIQELEEKVNQQKTLLSQRVLMMYKTSGKTILKMIFSNQNSASLDRQMKILSRLAQQDRTFMKDYTDLIKTLDSDRFKLANRLDKLKQVEVKLSQNEKQLTLEQQTKNKILNKIKSSKSFAIDQIKSLREQNEELDVLLRPSFFEKKGSLELPVRGTLVQKYGLIRDPQYNLTFKHKGLFLQTSVGTPIQTVFDGQVSFVGEVPGFGKTVIIDHGDHYYSTYAHADLVFVQLGQEIQQGQSIATVGATHPQFGSGLYFELRHFSEPYDPQQWMKGNNL